MNKRHSFLIAFLATLAGLLFSNPTSAQFYYTDSYNKDILVHTNLNKPSRVEFVIPQVNGLNVYKADLHIHTIYSDGGVTPEVRVKEAWYDGLDIIAITDHVEYRKNEKNMLNYLSGYHSKTTQAANTDVIRQDADDTGILADLNVSCDIAIKQGEAYGLTVIRGTEITREPISIGHYNALFTTDNNAIYDRDPVQAVKNAKAQGALIMHNHPGWKRKSVDQPQTEKDIYNTGAIDGIEVMNGSEFYPKVIDRANKQKLFVSANTDAHDPLCEHYRYQGYRRNMTLIFAKDKSPESIKKALEKRRTLAYSYNTIAGEESLLKDLFNACVSFEMLQDKGDKISYKMTNNSSFLFAIKEKGNTFMLEPFTSIIINVNSKSKSKTYTVVNMWCGEDAHPQIKIKF